MPGRCDCRTSRFVIGIVLCAMVFVAFMVFVAEFLRSRNESTVPKTFWRKDHATVMKYHIRDYRVPWSDQLLAAIAFARKHGEQLYLEDTPPTAFARNRGTVKTINISESELAELHRISSFLDEHCAPDTQNGDMADTIRVFPTAVIAANAKHLLDDVLAKHPQLFYAHYLLSVWSREQGDESAVTSLDRAFDDADCVVMCPVVMWDERSDGVVPVAETRFPFGVTTNHRTEQWGDLTLWYPMVETDRHGLVRLPVYREMICDPALETIDANGMQRTVETFGLRDIAKPYRFGLYVPVVLSGEEHSHLTHMPGFEEELRYVKRQMFAGLSIRDAETLGKLEIAFEKPGRLSAVGDAVIMPALHFANEFGDLHFRGLTRAELTQQIRQYRNEIAGQTSPLAIASGDNFIVSHTNGRTYLCRFLVSDTSQHPDILDVWDLGWVEEAGAGKPGLFQ